MTGSPPITAHLDAPVRARQHRGQLLHLLGRQREDVIDPVAGQEVVGVLAVEFLKFDIDTSASATEKTDTMYYFQMNNEYVIRIFANKQVVSA